MGREPEPKQRGVPSLQRPSLMLAIGWVIPQPFSNSKMNGKEKGRLTALTAAKRPLPLPSIPASPMLSYRWASVSTVSVLHAYSGWRGSH